MRAVGDLAVFADASDSGLYKSIHACLQDNISAWKALT